MSSSFQPSHQPSLSSSSTSTSSLLPANTPSPYANQANQTRILLVSDFDPSLKTRDLMDLLSEWEDDKGGFKLKWRDDTSAWIVFTDASVAKRAFLSLLTCPPRALLPPGSTKLHPNIVAYTGSDVPQILQAVQHRPRSHSNVQTSLHHHNHNIDRSHSHGGHYSHSHSHSNSQSQSHQHHSRTASWGRNSLDRRAAKDLIMEGGGPGGGGPGGGGPGGGGGNFASNFSSDPNSMTASGLPSSPFSSRAEGGGGTGGGSTSSVPPTDGRMSPEAFSQGHGGIIAGDTPRRIGNGFHRRTGSESTGGSRTTGSSIRE